MSKKFVVVVPDGCADYPIPELGNKTIFEAAFKPNLDAIAMTGIQGLSHTVPQHLPPGSDVAMTAVMGYDPATYYTGRAPIEAVAQGIDVSPTDWIFRTNLITINNDTMADHSAGHISSEEGKAFIDEMNKNFGSDDIRFYPGVGYRHLMVVKNHDFSEITTMPPHDHIGKKIVDLLPRGKNVELLNDIIAKSKSLFANHPINTKRKSLGKNTADSVWFWGQGKKAQMESFKEKYGLNGAVITAVDLVKGLGYLIGFDFIQVEGATGYFDTNYRGKGLAAIEALKNHDIVLVHVEATDEAGHEGKADVKKKALEEIDKHIIGPVMAELQNYDFWRIVVLPDHPTPVSTKGHVNEPVPFAMAGTGISGTVHLPLSEANAATTGIVFPKGFELMEFFLNGKP
ncbi:MAG TPA: cofactor-independent phosphoglycerate mutase [Bacteroidota bacterium]|nr:cofactor-independent phosphoglycerate mutase [Bacteroidota bacterium]